MMNCEGISNNYEGINDNYEGTARFQKVGLRCWNLSIKATTTRFWGEKYPGGERG